MFFIRRSIDIFISLLVILVSWPIMLYIARYINRKAEISAIFKQTRIKKNRRNYKDNLLVSRYFLHLKTREMWKDRRKCQDISSKRSLERRKTNSGRMCFFSLKEKKFKLERRKTDLLGQPFTFYKFSTMYKDARMRFPDLYKYNYEKEEVKQIKFKIDNDPRVPKWAEWLRQSSLDELPNFINVLRGDMSIVGPRPDIPEMIKYYTDKQKMKLKVKPGVTGLAQIGGRGNLSFQETLKCDIEYVKNQSLILDMKIFFKTIREAFNGNGAH